MNPFLYEPYNAYQKPAKKKHWHEIIEEEQLMARILAEQAAQAAAQQVQDTATAAAGAGGVPPWDYFNNSNTDVVAFSATPTAGASPLTVAFTNLTTTPQYDSYTWNFGDGQSSNVISPSHVYSNTGSYTASLSVSYSDGTKKYSNGGNGYIVVTLPVLTAGFTLTTSSATHPATVSFAQTTTYNGSGTLTYLWLYGTSSFTSSLTTAPSIVYSNAGGYTASLQVTESSYNIKSSFTRSFVLA